MATFTPPTIAEVSPLAVADSDHGPDLAEIDPAAARLFRFFKSRQRGVTIYKMSDGTYRSARPVPGVTVGNGGSVPVLEPWPPVPEAQVVNDAIAWSWSAYVPPIETPLPTPTVAFVYYGGHSYQVSAAEASALQAAGFGAYLS